MRMKKNCRGCRANYEGHCELGYRVEKVYCEEAPFKGLYMTDKPLEVCPKPTTIQAYLTEFNRRGEVDGHSSSDTEKATGA